ncbi:MAG TPA: prolyl oligopeptidase family serine peptidase, partial [Candidatus Synoicihabitans sp.]|nr:prolyl oligopeptidase family serine peptidase [Candidatus Synoicihabitans sp.]
AYLYGYGAFGWVAMPWYQPHVLAWLEMGGVYAMVNTRGGGEYGEPWRLAGIGRQRQNAIDDYLGAAQHLISGRYTSAKYLVANGGSASAPLAAAAIVQRPELFGASLIDIPILDLVRFARFTGGSRWIPEFGSPDDPDDLAALRRYSPYHNLERRCYPATLVTAGENDELAVPSHAYKFVARMQKAQTCDAPVLLNVSRGAGHSVGKNAKDSADAYARQLAFVWRATAPPERSVSR